MGGSGVGNKGSNVAGEVSMVRDATPATSKRQPKGVPMPRIQILIASAICVGFAGLLNAAEAASPLRPLEVSPQKDVGNPAFNTRSGGRVDTPLPRGAPTTIADLPSLRVAVAQLSESRSSQGSGSTNLNLTIAGEGLPPGATVRQVNVTKAVDNTDKPLPPGRSSGGRGGMSMSISMSSMMSGPGGMAQPMRATANLGVAPRSAESIKYVEGTIEVFVPAEANGSMIRIPNIKSLLGRVEDTTLAKYGIVFHFLGDKASEDEAKALMAGSGSSSRAPMDLVTGFGYYFRDPSNMLAGVQLLDGKGAPVQLSGGGGGGGSNGSLMSYSLRAPLADDTQLVIYVAVPEALKTVPFRVEDIALP
jgi:hypothetical protein